MIHTDSETEKWHDKARWVHLWSVHGYAVKLTLDVSRRLKVDHFGHWNFFIGLSTYIKYRARLKVIEDSKFSHNF